MKNLFRTVAPASSPESVSCLPAVTAILPAHNQGQHIGHVLAVLRAVEAVRDILIVDDGSTDDTVDQVEQARTRDARVRCLRLPQNQGQGAAMFAGARATSAPILLFLDADLSDLTPDHVRALIEPVRAGRADMTMGLFRGGRFHIAFAHWRTPWLTGQRCVRAELFFQVSEQNSSGYGIETALSLTARRYGWRCQRVPLGGVSHPPSEFHHGLWNGVRVRARMYRQILTTWRRERGWELLLPRLSTRERLALTLLLVSVGSSLAYDRSMAASHLRLENLPLLPVAGVHRLLVIAPHPDDETIGAGGAIQAALAAGVQVKVVVMTNGDGQLFAPLALRGRVVAHPADYLADGLLRQGEVMRATQALGLSSDAVLLLGYPDRGLLNLWLDDWTTACPYQASYTRVTQNPYAMAFDTQAVYCGSDVLADLRNVIASFKPDLVLLPHPNDEHPDHRAATSFTRLALALEMEADPAYRPAVWGYLVHYGYYPQPRGLHPGAALLPPLPLSGPGNEWARVDLTPAQQQTKILALQAYASQRRMLRSFLPSFARPDEIFVNLPALDLVPLAVNALPVRDSGMVQLPTVPEPAEESTRRLMFGGADLVGLQVGRAGDQLTLTAETRAPLFGGFRYRIVVKLPDGHTRIVRWPGPALRSGRSSFTALLNLADLGNPPVIAFAADVSQGATLDRTGWQFVILRDK